MGRRGFPKEREIERIVKERRERGTRMGKLNEEGGGRGVEGGMLGGSLAHYTGH